MNTQANPQSARPGIWARIDRWFRSLDDAFDYDPNAALEQRIAALENRAKPGNKV